MGAGDARYEKGAYYKADGTRIKLPAALPIDPRAEAERVYDGSSAGRAWIWDIALDSLGHPVMVYSVCPAETDHRYHYARWDGSRWNRVEMTRAGRWFPRTPAGGREPEPHYSGGIILDHEDPSTVYLSKPTNGVFEIERWTTPDGGKTWQSRMITSGSKGNNVRPVLPWAAPGQRRSRRMIFWMHGDYVHYTNYSTRIKYYLWPEAPTAVPVPPAPQASGLELRHIPGTLQVSVTGPAGEVRLASTAGRLIAAYAAGSGRALAISTRNLPNGLYHLSYSPGGGGTASQTLRLPIFD